MKWWKCTWKLPHGPFGAWGIPYPWSKRKISKCYMYLLSFSTVFFQFEAYPKPFRNALPYLKKVVKAFIQSCNGSWDILLLLLHKTVKKTPLYDPLGGIPILDSWKKLSLSISAMLLKVSLKNAFIDLRGGLRKQSCVRQLFFCSLWQKKKTASVEVLTATK